MIKIKVITDSSSGFSKEEAEKYNVVILPLTLSYDGKDYLDGIDITTDGFYKMFFENQERRGLARLDVLGLFNKDEKGFPKTSMVSPAVFEETFKMVIAEGYVPVVLPISKKLSGTYQSAIIAKDSLENDDIIVEDSASALGAVKVMIKSLLMKEYETKEDVIKEIDYLKKHINFYAVPETLAYLAKGGRLGKFSARVGNFLHFKPVIQLDYEGVLVPIDRPRGLKHAYKAVADYLNDNP
ncbi:MAG: DegV family protein, partial [Acholeplasmatales bacterium]|nr:DegV family protein [Acholeplasmatales bacterium]